MTMTDRQRTFVRKAWFSKRTADAVAASFGLASGQVVRNFWQAEKDAGRLPAHKARPHFEERTPVPLAPLVPASPALAPLDLDDEEADDVAADARPGCRVPPGDPLLAALIREHGDDPLVKLDGMPAWLIEQERTDKELRFTPSPERLRQFARVRDAYTAALGRIYSKKEKSNA